MIELFNSFIADYGTLGALAWVIIELRAIRAVLKAQDYRLQLLERGKNG